MLRDVFIVLCHLRSLLPELTAVPEEKREKWSG